MISTLLKRNEGKTLEFKENTKSLASIMKTVVSFANTAGGTIVIGVRDGTKEVVGVSDPLEQEERLANAMAETIAPLLIADVSIQTHRKKEIIIIDVPHAVGPYYIKSDGPDVGVYVRLGSTNRRADSDTLFNLRLHAQNLTFDEIPYKQGAISLLDFDAMQKAFKNVGKKFTIKEAESLNFVVEIGNKMVPTYGGILLCGKQKLKLFPDARIRCARFLGNDKIELLDQLEVETHLPLAVDEVMNFIRRNTTMRAKITGLYREDIPQFPVEAIREALLNAIVHADYSQKGIPISIAIFDERIEIKNPGSLPYGMYLEKALSGYSHARNRIIAKCFARLGIVEQWGSGLRKIIDACKLRGLKPPRFQEWGNEFCVTLYSVSQEQDTELDWDKSIVEHLKKKSKVSTKEAALFWQVTPRTARIRLVKLINAGILKQQSASLVNPRGAYMLAK